MTARFSFFMGLLVWGLATDASQAQTMSTLCTFDSGPRAGETQDYAPKAPLPVGSPCHDGAGSTGKVVAAGGTPTLGGGGKSTLCKFDSGPRAGETQDYAPKAPLPVGGPCHDGAGSTGKVVAAGGSGGKSTLCKFDSGPRAGETQDYAPMAPLAVGSPCHDGAGSTGKVVAKP